MQAEDVLVDDRDLRRKVHPEPLQVDDVHLVPALEEGGNERRSDVAGTPDDQDPHRLPPLAATGTPLASR